jgi:TM2 domain-containing membrane protein YozV
MKQNQRIDSYIYVVIVAIAAWLIPGAGHLIIKRPANGLIIFIGISAAFVMGLWIGSIAVINPVLEYLWYIPQIMVSPFVKIIGNITVTRQLDVFGRPNEIGQIYTSMAGMLNLLCIVQATHIAYKSKFASPVQES